MLRDVLLASRGYEVVAVPFEVWSRMSGEEERSVYLAAQLEQACDGRGRQVASPQRQAVSSGAAAGAGAVPLPRRQRARRASEVEVGVIGSGQSGARTQRAGIAGAKGSGKQTIARLAQQGRPGAVQQGGVPVARPMHVAGVGSEEEVDVRGSRRHAEPVRGAAGDVPQHGDEVDGSNGASPNGQQHSLLEYADDEFDVSI